MLGNYMVEGLEKILNRILQDDPDHAYILKPLINRHICLKIKQPSIELHFTFHYNEIRIRSSSIQKPDCIITGDSLKLLTYYLAPQHAALNTLHIEGSITIAQNFARLCQQLRIDWESLMAKFVGQQAAHVVHRSARQLLGLAKQHTTTLKTDLNEFVQHEMDLSPHPIELNEFLDKIDTLRHDVERLIARFAILKQHLG
jgi:ubiquinone biosynthesis accessory factor UbiJ